MVKSLFVAVSLFLLAGTSLAAEFPASQLCVHEKCLGGINYCAVRYSYGTVSDSKAIDNNRYLVPQNTTMTEGFKGTCVPNRFPASPEFPASKLCIHAKCLGPTNYCVVRYSYGTIKAGVIDNKRYLVPQDTTMTESFNGTCVSNA
ncbi:hypothetical protein BGX28_009627 [Mortierella sp. GBA30]|nr:hypothetical protein BGX28_009627 [Mortierella sp. GBA30]